MDDALIQEWRGGQPHATTAVRNAVRSTAERVLGHPLLLQHAGPRTLARLRSEEERREATQAVATEVMSRRVTTAAQLSAMSRMVAARVAVEALQESHPPGEAAHLPAPVAVSHALAPDGLLPRVRDAAARHLERCSHCANDQRILKAIAAALVEPVSIEPLPAAEPAPAADVDALYAAAAADLGAGARPRPRPAGSSKARSKPARVLPDPEPEPRRAWVGFAVLTAGIAALGVWLALGGDAPVLPSARNPALAELADRSAPDVGRLRDLPGEVQFAVADLASGDCRTAAARMRAARSQQPDAARLYVLEAASQICAGDGKSALAALADMDSMLDGQRPPKASHWYRAQAHLLRGEGTQALAALGETVAHDPKHRKEADQQRTDIQGMLGE